MLHSTKSLAAQGVDGLDVYLLQARAVLGRREPVGLVKTPKHIFVPGQPAFNVIERLRTCTEWTVGRFNIYGRRVRLPSRRTGRETTGGKPGALGEGNFGLEVNCTIDC